MAEPRFPKRKYLRQIADMESDFGWWHAQYREMWETASPPALALRAGARVQVLEAARDLLFELYHELEALPRLK